MRLRRGNRRRLLRGTALAVETRGQITDGTGIAGLPAAELRLKLIEVAAHALNLAFDRSALRRRHLAENQESPVVAADGCGIGNGPLQFAALLLSGAGITCSFRHVTARQRGDLSLDAPAIAVLCRGGQA